MEKICSKCTLEKDLADFKKDNRNKSGYCSTCKSCHNVYNKQNEKKTERANKNFYSKERMH